MRFVRLGQKLGRTMGWRAREGRKRPDQSMVSAKTSTAGGGATFHCVAGI
ncbi:MAG TPA: hypothetical protein VGR52_01530 [Stellaceae bacterium]|nr:hypothetical protein [Stellaceae bacterium]